jgi:prophage tail gpP-like protein
MAISFGAGPHRAWLNGVLVEQGTVDQNANKKSSTFAVSIPMSWDGALGFVGGGGAVINVQSHGLEGVLLTGVIDTITVDFIRTNVQITGRDMSALLHDQKSSQKFLNQTGSNIVEQLAGQAGIGVQASGGGMMAGKMLQQDYVRLSDNISAASVIHKLAEFDGANWFVDNMGILHYGENLMAGVYTINYKYPTADSPMVCDALELRVTKNIPASKGANVTVKSWHPKEKKVNQGKSGGGSTMYNYHMPTLTQQQAQKHAESKSKEHSRHAITVTATCVGDPTINPAMGLALSGTGLFDGTYEIDHIGHNFGMVGHKMTITAKGPGTGGGGE